jgi:hypothetical protein
MLFFLMFRAFAVVKWNTKAEAHGKEWQRHAPRWTRHAAYDELKCTKCERWIGIDHVYIVCNKDHTATAPSDWIKIGWASRGQCCVDLCWCLQCAMALCSATNNDKTWQKGNDGQAVAFTLTRCSTLLSSTQPSRGMASVPIQPTAS